MKKKKLSILDKAGRAMERAVDDVVESHQRQGRPLKVSRESIKNMASRVTNHVFKEGKEYVISKYSPKRYFVIVVSKSGSVVPVFPFASRKETMDYINGRRRKG